MKLEEQIKKLAELGLPLNDGITVDDFLLSWPREDFEETPFDMILFSYGSEVEEEPWGRYFCDRVWNFDAECIEDSGDYVAIVEQFHRITGREKQLFDLSDQVDVDAGQACLRYTVNGVRRELDVNVSDDWADPETAQIIMEDLASEGFDFYGKPNGQSTVWFYMTPRNAYALNVLAGNVFGIEKKPWWKVWQK